MAAMGRKRKSNDLGLEPRVYAKHSAFYYVHRDGRWERLGVDLAEANRKARIFNDPDGSYGTMAYWLDMFLIDCETRVKAEDLAARTLSDYKVAVNGRKDTPGALKVFFAPPLSPIDITPAMVQDFLDIGRKAGRPVPANREKACLSSCISWLIRTGQVPGLKINPCMKQSGIQRNPESKRDRYVEHWEYQATYAAAPAPVRLMMALTYRTLQRPESDIIMWTPANVIRDADGQRKIKHRQNKTGTELKIGLSAEVDQLIRAAMGEVPVLHQTIIHNRQGKQYTYTGLMSMLTASIKRANKARAGQEPIKAFGFRDLKGKGATDMYFIGQMPIEQIQQLLGHADKATTEIYIKARWRETAAPNLVAMAV